MGDRVTVTPLDQFDHWRRDGERKLQELISYREGAQDRLASAQAELARVDAAIDAVSLMLGEVSRASKLEALLAEALRDLAYTHPLQARAREALGRELRSSK